MESQPQNPEFRINPENFHPWGCRLKKLAFYVLDKFLTNENPCFLLQSKYYIVL